MTSTPQPDAATDRSSRRAAVFLRRAVSEVRGLRSDQGRARLLAAATALGVVLVARFALGLAALVGSALGYSVTPWPSDFTATPVGQFLGSFVLYPFPFYLVAFVVLLLVRPIDPGLSLPRALRHGLLAGTAGTVALALVGIVPGVAASLSGGTWVNLALYLTTIPFAAGVVDTALLLVGVVLAWHASRTGAAAGETVAGPDGDAIAEEAPAGPSAAAPHPAREPAPAQPEAGDVAPPEDGPAGSARPPAVLPPALATRPTPPRGASAADDWSRFAPPAADDGDGR
ncbi:hypothetical protein [Frigoribacterium sp. VKM Ac-2530]|uniref:hypothetical protein n=1 Tax=Frigoribacterium sp. VKM Ac-2530 TaxID=2783822 RepID=UPI00188D1DAE|nr:hypothetical protein [Frigoribacterium sp. VKM Ac-2530]MBF4579806.1 hypothetical protein [Frigoribacterium sp. VKM Ac-2530]